HPARNGMTYKWMTAQLFDHFGESETLNRVPSAVIGLLITVSVYALGRVWFSPIVGFLAAFLYAVWPWSVTWGRIGRFYNLQQLFFVGIVYFTWRLLDRHLANSSDPFKKLIGKLWGSALALACLTLLSLLTSFTTFHSLCFIPVYLILLLLIHRGRRDSERRRILIGYFALGTFILAIAAAGLFWMDSDYVRTIWRNTRALELVPTFYLDFFRNNFGLAFSTLALAGMVMCFYQRSPGLLLISTLLGPWLVHTFAVTYYRPRFIYYLFPFLCLTLSLPVGWAVERFRQFVHEREYRVTFFGPGPVLAILILGLFGQSIYQNVFNSNLSTWNIVTGKNATFAREVPNFRAVAEKLKPLTQDALVVTTDPVLSSYYLGRSDYVFPQILPRQNERHYNMDTLGLTPEEFLNLANHPKAPLVLIGTVRKIDGVLTRPEMADISRVLKNCEKSWEIEGARSYHWGGSSADSQKLESSP
ncbi:MAG: glycosyltransferase family 39 protein, partial [Candidatus Omnitrophica bacterium]|nr:glycosyltransferase family 39 protein [Candidatus Omnitrophota bacterium]